MSSGRLPRLLRSTVFRLTVLNVGLFVTGLVVLSLLAGMSARGAFEWRKTAQIQRTMAELTRIHAGQGPDALARQLASLELPEGIEIVTNLAGVVAADRLAGLSQPDPGWSSYMPPYHDPDEAFQVLTSVLADGTRISVGMSDEAASEITDLMLGGIVWAIVIALPLSLLCGTLLSLQITHRLSRVSATAEGIRAGDLSRRAVRDGSGDEFDRLAAQVNAMLDRVEELNAGLRSFSIGIAHELRTPMTRIRNRLADSEHDAAHGRNIDIPPLLAEVDSLLTTFDALLLIGRLKAQGATQQQARIDISELVADLIDTYEPVAEDSGRRLNGRVAPGIGIRGNPHLLTQMMSNLVDNAIEHTPPGTSIQVTLDKTPGGATLIVQDDAAAIAPMHEPDIFRPFFAGDPYRGAKGAGLGLSIVHAIAGLHGFRIDFDGSAGRTSFRIEMAAD